MRARRRHSASIPPATPITPAAIAASSSAHSVNTSPSATGTVDWNAIAPVMFPIASSSFESRTQRKLLAFSGSSVASGASMSERISASTPRSSAMWVTSSTNSSAPPMISASPRITCAAIWGFEGGSCLVVSKVRGRRWAASAVSPPPRTVYQA
jgi:hypothetical protein